MTEQTDSSPSDASTKRRNWSRAEITETTLGSRVYVYLFPHGVTRRGIGTAVLAGIAAVFTMVLGLSLLGVVGGDAAPIAIEEEISKACETTALDTQVPPPSTKDNRFQQAISNARVSQALADPSSFARQPASMEQVPRSEKNDDALQSQTRGNIEPLESSRGMDNSTDAAPTMPDTKAEDSLVLGSGDSAGGDNPGAALPVAKAGEGSTFYVQSEYVNDTVEFEVFVDSSGTVTDALVQGDTDLTTKDMTAAQRKIGAGRFAPDPSAGSSRRIFTCKVVFSR